MAFREETANFSRLYCLPEEAYYQTQKNREHLKYKVQDTRANLAI